jgi:hypothetical protein
MSFSRESESAIGGAINAVCQIRSRPIGRAQGGRSAAARPRTLYRRFCAARVAVATLYPLLLAGQVHGGTVQGVGQALLERAVYDPESGQLVTASLMGYAVPRADEVPAIVFETFVAGITRWA